MENLALFVLGVIILVNLIAVGLVMFIGNQHDHHHEIREESQADSLARLKAQYDFPERAAQVAKPVEPTAPAVDPAQTEAMADQLAEAVAQLPDEDKAAPA